MRENLVDIDTVGVNDSRDLKPCAHQGEKDDGAIRMLEDLRILGANSSVSS